MKNFMTIYRFRKLTSEIDYCRLREILETGKFWCSNFWELNDPMEGVFNMFGECHNIKKIQEAKERYNICSFSGEEGFENPAVWGYYTNGFKGVAVGIKIKNNEVENVNYDNNLPDESDVKKILLNKGKAWERENEYRFLDNLDNTGNNQKKIGEIKAVYFGDPYGDLVNSQEIKNKIFFIVYTLFKKEIIQIAKEKDIKCFNVKIENGIVKKMDKNLWSQK